MEQRTKDQEREWGILGNKILKLLYPYSIIIKTILILLAVVVALNGGMETLAYLLICTGILLPCLYMVIKMIDSIKQ